jgi:phosphoglycolate phosphatase-like HAD superfamily hydrolase
MQNKTTSLIFDFDGVIADTDTGRFLVLNEILKKYGLNLYDSFSREDIVGYSTKGFLKKNLTELTLNEIDEIVAERHKLFFSGLDKYCISFQNMKETVEYFNNRYKLFIATTNDVENVKRMLKHLGIFELF